MGLPSAIKLARFDEVPQRRCPRGQCKSGPIIIAGFTFDNTDQRWNGDNEGELTLAKLAQAIVQKWSPAGLDPGTLHWENPLELSSEKH